MFRKALPMLGISGGVGSSVYLYVNEDDRIKTVLLSKAVLRTMDLIATAGLIVVDYASTIQYIRIQKHFNKKIDTYDQSNNRLKTLQQMQEDATIELVKCIQSSNTEGQMKYKQEIEDNRKEMDRVSDFLGDMDAVEEGQPYTKAHIRCATRLKNMCERNKGIYIKLGQHISMLDHITPSEYQDILSSLLSKTPTSSSESIRRIIKQDLGDYPENVWERFDMTPIASASLAQVHIAYDKTGQKHAVKVQHEGLLESYKMDIAVIEAIISFISNTFEGFNYNWLVVQMKENLPKELNFQNEMENLLKCTQQLDNLIKSGDVVIPKCYKDFSSKRVLSMSFEEGKYITDDDTFAVYNIKQKDVSRLISTVFCEQIFKHGFVHCDPHEANILVRAHPHRKNYPQIVLLDHGLYQDLGDNFRREYCRLWKALVTSDEDGIKRHCTTLNAGKMYTLFAAMLTMKPWDDIVSDDIDRLKSKNTKGEKEILKAYANRYFKDIVGLLGSIPSVFLLVLKTNDCLRHLDKKLGTPINTFAVVADVTSEVIKKEDMSDAMTSIANSSSSMKYVKLAYKMFTIIVSDWNVHIRVAAVKTISNWFNLRNSIMSYFI